MIKLVQFIHGFNMGGAETLVKDYCLGIDSNEVDLSVLCLEHRESGYEEILSDAGVKVTYLCDELLFPESRNVFVRLINRFYRIYRLKKYFSRVNPDVIHTHLAQNKYLYLAGLKKNVGIIYTHHYSVAIWKKEGKKDLKYAQKLFANHKMKIIALNQNMKKELAELFPIKDIEVINNGVFREKFSTCIDKEKARKEIGVPTDSFLIGHVGRFCKAKNHDFLLEIFREIKKVNIKAKLLLIGTGETLPLIQKKIHKLKIDKDVLILENRKDIPMLMSAMDLLIFPSIYEGMPVTLIEAQFAKLPCIVSDRVDTRIKISNLVKFISLNCSAEEWAKQAMNFNVTNVEYYNAEEWDMNKIIKKLQLLYEEVSV